MAVDRADAQNELRRGAAELVRLQDDLQRAHTARHGSDEAERAWRATARTSAEATRAFYARFTGLARPIRAGDRGAIDAAIQFLEADPWCFRSGYVKAELMSALAHAPLGDDDRRRLRAVVGNRVRHREPRLLRPTGRLAASVWDDGLAIQIGRLLADGDDAQRADAAAVLETVEQMRRTTAGQRRDG